jgi:hypothetical protein
VTLWEAAADLPPAAEAWPYDDELPDGGRRVAGVDVTYPRSGSSGWDWDPDAGEGGAWVRTQDGREHVTPDGDRLAADNVIVPILPATGLSTRPVDVVGEGEATVLRNGEMFAARWRKSEKWSQFEWLTPDGEPLPLAPGRTWIELVPTTGQVEVRGSATIRGDTPTP